MSQVYVFLYFLGKGGIVMGGGRGEETRREEVSAKRKNTFFLLFSFVNDNFVYLEQ